MLTFQDIFKSSFLENAASVSLFDMALALLLFRTKDIGEGSNF